MNHLLKLVIAVMLPLAVGATGSFFTTPEIPGWYQLIRKPTWNPPNWLFGPVWTLLYFLMGIALYLVWKSESLKSLKQKAILAFAIQLIFNFFWSIIFFKYHQMGWAFVEIVVLCFCIVINLFYFSKIHMAAAWLLVPYLVWVSFAAVLNYKIWQMNMSQ